MIKLLLILLLSLWAHGADKPNVLMIAIDDLNSWAGSLKGHPQAHTPHIDRLAKRGLLFRSAHCAPPACNPSPVAMMAGMRPSTSGIYYNWQDWRYIRYANGSAELYDHRKDPNECANLANRPEYTTIIKAHAAKLPGVNAPLKGTRKPKKKK